MSRDFWFETSKWKWKFRYSIGDKYMCIRERKKIHLEVTLLSSVFPVPLWIPISGCLLQLSKGFSTLCPHRVPLHGFKTWPALSSIHTQYLAVLLDTFWVPHNMKSIFVNLKRYLPQVTNVILYIFQVSNWDLYNFKSLEMDLLLEASSAPRQAFFFLCLSRMTRTLVVLLIYQK